MDSLFFCSFRLLLHISRSRLIDWVGKFASIPPENEYFRTDFCFFLNIMNVGKVLMEKIKTIEWIIYKVWNKCKKKKKKRERHRETCKTLPSIWFLYWIKRHNHVVKFVVNVDSFISGTHSENREIRRERGRERRILRIDIDLIRNKSNWLPK